VMKQWLNFPNININFKRLKTNDTSLKKKKSIPLVFLRIIYIFANLDV